MKKLLLTYMMMLVAGTVCISNTYAIGAAVVTTQQQPTIMQSKPVTPFIPPSAYIVAPKLRTTIESKWPALKYPHFIAGQIEQETCISLKHSKCFTSRAELKTSREWGVGFGQFTVAYSATGKVRFDALAEVRAMDKDLVNYTTANRYDERLGLIAIVVRDKNDFLRVRGAKTELDQFAFMFSGYNGGAGSVLKDRVLCKSTIGCDSAQWFGHVEKTSYKSRVAAHGYGQSWYAINRGYVNNIINVRSDKYKQFFL